ncbi:MAG: class I SAM-dependent methyltransferase [Ferruginibacter sp.]|nr:class I SAM-dependent methyltransferase [Ferruginibacter sp.]
MMIETAKKYLKEIQTDKFYTPIHKKYLQFTMVKRRDYIDCLKLVSRFKHINGSIIECGVWRGGMIAGIADVMGNARNYYLFDSFEGLPDAKEIDGQTAIAWQADKTSAGYYDNCKAEMEWAQKAIGLAGVTNKTSFIKGWFDDTVPQFKADEPIAVLRLDGDWYDSTMVCLDHLFPKVAEGGLIILDDYYAWDGCSKALHDYLSKHKRPERIVQAYSSGCYLIKKHDP